MHTSEIVLPIERAHPGAPSHVTPLLIAIVELLAAAEGAPSAKGSAALRACLAGYVRASHRCGVPAEEMLRRLRRALRQSASSCHSRLHYDTVAACVMPWALAEYYSEAEALGAACCADGVPD